MWSVVNRDCHQKCKRVMVQNPKANSIQRELVQIEASVQNFCLLEAASSLLGGGQGDHLQLAPYLCNLAASITYAIVCAHGGLSTDAFLADFAPLRVTTTQRSR